MSDKRSEKTIWELAVEERDRVENCSSQEQEEESQVSNSDESSIFFLGSKNSVSSVTFMNTEIYDKASIDPFPIPLAIIGGKYDIYQDFDPEKRKMISRTLRFTAHRNGAHLQFFSTKSEGLTSRTRALVGSLLFHTPLNKVVSVDHNKPIIVPAGQDSFQQIGAPPVTSQDSAKMHSRPPYEQWKASYSTFFPPQKSQGRNTSEDPSRDPQYIEPTVDTIRKQKDEVILSFMSVDDHSNERN
ncbi:PREDICTED: cytoplasmic dynein 2 light intermediate chain 1-like [Acropora digitifera]|uniref:cytoplasmic dynein 2 light intermediate chain 1-like n=1 Tax=Acropora digitifera TaxID=70779 RepID=UPI00077A3273|nr:PREDICTED: cytoplasmic dynein 2 light intermediate chain 1-like [Acropora digitifera]